MEFHSSFKPYNDWSIQIFNRCNICRHTRPWCLLFSWREDLVQIWMPACCTHAHIYQVFQIPNSIRKEKLYLMRNLYKGMPYGYRCYEFCKQGHSNERCTVCALFGLCDRVPYGRPCLCKIATSRYPQPQPRSSSLLW